MKCHRQGLDFRRACQIDVGTGTACARLHVDVSCRACSYEVLNAWQAGQAGKDGLLRQCEFYRDDGLVDHFSAHDFKDLAWRCGHSGEIAHLPQESLEIVGLLRRRGSYKYGSFISHQHYQPSQTRRERKHHVRLRKHNWHVRSGRQFPGLAGAPARHEARLQATNCGNGCVSTSN